MDNFRLDIRSEGFPDLELALRLSLSRGNDLRKLRIPLHFKELRLSPDKDGRSKVDPTGTRTLVLLYNSNEGGELITKTKEMLPFDLNVQQLKSFVSEWLSNVPEVDYAEYSDHDGSSGHGWRVFTDFWGHVAGHHYAICGIQPIWAWYGK